MTFTRRLTGFENPADFVFSYEGKDVGRCYRDHFGMQGQGWRWSIYETNLCGIEETLDTAQEKFKAAFLAWRERAATSTDPSDS